ncbi:MAG: hypothetical protein Q7T99_16230 [Pseudomonas sp.]|nr:hypothetical protein [Pseudomonas sp.]
MNNPSADYPQGSFKNRTAPSAKDGSYLEQDWANDKEGFFQSLLAAAGVAANGAVDKVGASQFFDAIQKLKQSQSGTAFTTAGSAAALTLTPTPAIDAYTAPLRFRVRFSQNSTPTSTINVSSKGAKALKQYDAAGAKIAAVYFADQLGDIEYDGADFVLLDQLPSSNLVGIKGDFSNLKGGATGLSAVSTITADELMLESSTGSYLTVRNINLSPSFANANGLNGLDTGTVQASSFYDRWVISNGTTVGALFCAYGNSPVMPAGYTFKARVGPVRTDATANKFPLPFIQFGRRFNYVPKPATNLTAPPQIANGVVPFPTAVGWGGYAPPGAGSLYLKITHAQAGAGWLSSSPDYQYQYTQSVSGNSSDFTVQLPPVSASVYWGASTGTAGTPALFLMGWEENL